MPRSSQKPKPHAVSAGNVSLFPIVGVGASAGGLEALTALLKELPTDTGMTFLLVQHLDALEAEAEAKGGVQQVLEDHFTKVYKVSTNLASLVA